MALVLVGKKGLLIAAIRTGLDGSLLPLPLIRLEVCDCEELLAMLASALNNDGNSARTKKRSERPGRRWRYKNRKLYGLRA